MTYVPLLHFFHPNNAIQTAVLKILFLHGLAMMVVVGGTFSFKD
jgi:hypothetical protein